MNDVPVRDAATVILVRQLNDTPHILMGQRGKSAAFMPNKFVFPGGAVDVEDETIPLSSEPDPICVTRLSEGTTPGRARAFLAAAIRETWEETGLRLANRGPEADLWDGFSHGGFAPSAQGLRYIFRAITPPGRPRRFDARFFIANATDIVGDPDDFSKACDELSHLHWVSLAEARALDLPFITEVVLAEVGALAQTTTPPDSVPFFDNSGPTSMFRRIF